MQHELIFSFFVTVASFFGIELAPYGDAVHWKNPEWVYVNGSYKMGIESLTIADECRTHPHSYVNFPAVLQSIQRVYADDRLIQETGGKSVDYIRTIVNQSIVHCEDLQNVHKLRWEAITPTKNFAQIPYLPYVSRNYPRTGEVSNAINILGAGAAFMLALVSLILFRGNSIKSIRARVFLANVGAAIYAAMMALGGTGVWLSTTMIHRIALSASWVAAVSMISLYRSEGYVSKWPYRLWVANVLFGNGFIFFGRNSDEIAFGSIVVFPATFLFLTYMTINLFRNKDLRQKAKLYRFFYLACPTVFSGSIMIEMFGVMRLFIGPMLLPLGTILGLFSFMLSENERINETYRERDYLRHNLEDEVARKTEELAQAMRSLLETQAQLVQNAKLASVGTLAAGLAHEMNNALNFMSGAVTGFKRSINELNGEKKKEVQEMISVMDSGLRIATTVVKSLKSHTGINQAKFKDMNLKSIIQDTIILVKSRMINIELSIDVPENLTIHGSVTGLNQVIINLVLNSVDAIGGKPGKIKISAGLSLPGNMIELKIEDSGAGIPKILVDRIFDPFFTTKEIGKGSGLGLYIVKNEIENLQGSIEVRSILNQGTTFVIRIPRVSSVRAS